MIRKVTPKDREIFIELGVEFYASDAVSHNIPKTYLERAFDELMRSEDRLNAYLFEVEGIVVGYALIAKMFSCEAGGICNMIEELYIREEHRGKHLASNFFEFISRTRPNEVKRFRLEAVPENERAIRLYKRYGFDTLNYLQLIREFE